MMDEYEQQLYRERTRRSIESMTDVVTDKLSQLPDMALLLVTIEIARVEQISYDQAASRALDALYWVRQAQQTWTPPTTTTSRPGG